LPQGISQRATAPTRAQTFLRQQQSPARGLLQQQSGLHSEDNLSAERHRGLREDNAKANTASITLAKITTRCHILLQEPSATVIYTDYEGE